jgi:hypothetical protein
MAKRRIEDDLERIGALRDAAPDAAVPALRKALADRVNLVVAKAAQTVAAMQLRDLIPDCQRAFDRLFDDPVRRDPQCWGKNALAQALKDLDHDESEPFVHGLHHVQMEPVWGGQEDTATTLRGTCVLALVHCRDLPRAAILRHLADALADPVASVRVEAARALELMDGDDSALLLRLKARLGDELPQVTGQAIESLLAIEGESGLPFAAEFLRAESSETAQEAALAVGTSRLPGAVSILREAWERSRNPEMRSVLLRAVSVTRQPEAIDFLTGLLVSGRRAESAAATEALAIHRETEDVRDRVAQAVERTGSEELEQLFQRMFGAARTPPG